MNILTFEVIKDCALSIEVKVKMASRYEVWGSVVQLQRWWIAGNGKHLN